MMYQHGILKVATATPKLEVGKPLYNVNEIIKVLTKTEASIVVFPELALTGYTCGDLFYQDLLLNEALAALKQLLETNFPGVFIVGMPLDVDGVLYNCAVVCQKDKVLGVIPKFYNPNTNEFYEKRWFNSGSDVSFKEVTILNQKVPFGQILFKDTKNEINFAVEICQDMWMPISPGNYLSLVGANLIINLSASNIYVGKKKERRRIVIEHSRKNHGAYLYTSSGVAESTSETVFSGHNIHSVLGKTVNEAHFTSFETEVLTSDLDFGLINYTRRKDASLKDSLHKYKIDYQTVEVKFAETTAYQFAQKLEKSPLLPVDNEESFAEIRLIQTRALAKRLVHLDQPKIIVGVSGGLDSSFALLVAVDTFKYLKRDIKDIIAVSMPGLASSEKTINNAKKLSQALNVTFKEIDIKEETQLHFKMIGQDKSHEDTTYENTQARIRTMALMNLANKNKAIVLGTGSLSEIALGFMTYNADQMSMYAINSGMPKTLIKRQFKKYQQVFPKLSNIIEEILLTPISPELIANQKTEEIIGSYEINDYLIYRHLVAGDDDAKMIFMLKHAFELSDEEAKEAVKRFLSRFYSSQFKRQVMPDGPKVVNLSLSAKSEYKLNSDVRKK